MIHKFCFDDLKMVLDVNSGALHIVDELTWELLEHYSVHSREEILSRFAGRYDEQEVGEALDEIDSLVQKKQLFSPDPLGGRYEPPASGIVKALCLHLAHDCNLSCRYCFAGHGQFNGPTGLMPFDVGRQALDFLFEHSGNRRHVEVDFFGGEPLLNFGVLKELVTYGRERAAATGKEIKFTVTTNGVLLTPEIGRYLNENDLAVVLSLDGRPAVHDTMRPFPSGRGSYALVAENIRRFVLSRLDKEYYVRGTFTAHNLDFAQDVLHMADLGFEQISVEPVVAPYEEEYALRPEHLPVIYKEYENLTRALLERIRQGQKINFYHFDIDLNGGPCLPRRLSGCSAGNEYLAVAPDGSLYPCHQFVGRPGYRMGSVSEGIKRLDLVDTFRRCHVYTKKDCPDCWARFFCSGGCHANAQAFHGDIRQPYELACQLIKKRLECTFYFKARLALDSLPSAMDN